MTVCLFLTSNAPATDAPTADDTTRWLADFGSMPGLQEVRAHLPATAVDPMLDDGAGPPLVMQFFFDHVTSLETNLQFNGQLMSCLQQSPMPALMKNDIDHQAMLTRRYGCPAGNESPVDHHQRCTYLVRYAGPAADPAAWLGNYLQGHPPLMMQLPGIRALEIFSRIDWCSSLPFTRNNDLQRNQVVFDSADALTTALNSPLRAQMRKHFDALPPFEGPVTHFPMHTLAVTMAGASRPGPTA